MHILTTAGWKPLRKICRKECPDSHMLILKPYYRSADEWCADLYAQILSSRIQRAACFKCGEHHREESPCSTIAARNRSA